MKICQRSIRETIFPQAGAVGELEGLNGRKTHGSPATPRPPGPGPQVRHLRPLRRGVSPPPHRPGRPRGAGRTDLRQVVRPNLWLDCLMFPICVIDYFRLGKFRASDARAHALILNYILPGCKRFHCKKTTAETLAAVVR